MEPSFENAQPTLAEVLALAESMPKVLPRELHVRNRGQLLKMTGAEVSASSPTANLGGLPVYCDDAMPNGVMEMRNSETGEVLRRWFLRPDGTLIAVNPTAFKLPEFKFSWSFT